MTLSYLRICSPTVMENAHNPDPIDPVIATRNPSDEYSASRYLFNRSYRIR